MEIAGIIDNQPVVDNESKEKTFEGVPVRRNLNETAFFYPELRTNEKGEIVISFTVPEALTKWKFMGFALYKRFEEFDCL